MLYFITYLGILLLFYESWYIESYFFLSRQPLAMSVVSTTSSYENDTR